MVLVRVAACVAGAFSVLTEFTASTLVAPVGATGHEELIVVKRTEERKSQSAAQMEIDVHPMRHTIGHMHAGFNPATSTMNSATTLMTSHACWLQPSNALKLIRAPRVQNYVRT
jgi:hypothetical protein